MRVFEALRVRLLGGGSVQVLFQCESEPTRRDVDHLIAMLQLGRDQYPEPSPLADDTKEGA